jgi:hypothetical protein
MDGENTIIEIELLEHIFSLPDKRPLRTPDWKAANKKHDERMRITHGSGCGSGTAGKHKCCDRPRFFAQPCILPKACSIYSGN